MLGSIFNKAAGLKVYNSIKTRLQHSCFPVKLANFLKTPFFIEEFQWLLLPFNSCFQRHSEQNPVWLSAINTRFSWIKYLLPRKWRCNHYTCNDQCKCFPVNIAKFLGTSIWKTISERLLAKIRTSATNSSKGGNSWILLSFWSFSYSKFCYDQRHKK